ncbi:helix-turn-helix transcriptional regulator [Sphingomonas sp. 35-24ZXX]|uniref:helix-turn-helix transcriptional regulator n=1 Tax=Sphingomonas sp. 35-24ZXX TaxID=1545915 RepID=UPI00068B8BF3|nr:helix-turn-helix domain-containing protein [Sphingomonas sp. 35-24ZXX]
MEQQPFPGLLTTQDLIPLLRLSRTSIYRMTRQGRFPSPCGLGNGQIRWREADVRAWMTGLPSQTYLGDDRTEGTDPGGRGRPS